MKKKQRISGGAVLCAALCVSAAIFFAGCETLNGDCGCTAKTAAAWNVSPGSPPEPLDMLVSRRGDTKQE